MSSGELRVQNCTLDGNTASYGGSIYSEGAVVLIDTLITHSIADYGGAVHIVGSSSSLSVSGSRFNGNTARFSGGSIFCYDAGGELNDTLIANGGTTYGGAIAIFSSSLSVSGSQFDGSTAYYGGAVYINGSSLSVSGSSFNGNTAIIDGGSIFCSYDTIVYWGQLDGITRKTTSTNLSQLQPI